MNNGTADLWFGLGIPFSSTVNNTWSINSVTIANTANSFDLTHTGPHTLTIQSSLTDNSSNSVAMDVSLLGAMNLLLTGNGTLTFSQANSYTGSTALSAGTLADSAANEFSPNSAVLVGAGATLDVNFDESVLSLANDTGGGTVVIAGGAVLTMNGGSTTSFSGTITGGGGLQLAGASILTLTGASNYSGATSISSGSTLIAGSDSALGTSSVTLSGGSTLNVMGGFSVSNVLSFSGTGNQLAGSGTFARPTVVDSGVILSPSASPGNGPGNLTFSSGLTLATGGTISFKLYDANGAAGTGYSLVTASGGLTLSAAPGTLTFDLVSVDSSGNPMAAINFSSGNSYSWKFATSPTAISGFAANQFALNTSGFANATGGGTFGFTEVGNNLYLNFTPVPEPETWAMLSAGILLVLPYALRRRQPSKT